MLARWPIRAATILDSFATRNSAICSLCTLALFGQSAPQKRVVILHWQYCVIVDVLSVFGWLVHFRILYQSAMRI